MPRYILKMAATAETIAAIIASPSNRAEAVRPIFEAVGGKLEQYYFEVGGTTSYLVVEVPTQEDMAAIGVAVFASGALKSIQTIPIMTSKEGVEVYKKAASVAYKPPSG